ncbi:MAG: large subunit ribosomal protein L9 [Alphaproteobacteria bacterium]|jgi:large subunit ribosomal protein L9
MQVILLERIARLGNMGDTVEVKAGFGRNFLLPQSKALPATKANLAKYEAQRSELMAKSEDARQVATGVSETFNDTSVTLIRQASETGQLYGSVKAADIANSLIADGKQIKRSMVQIGEPIKSLGEFEVRIALHPEVAVKVAVNVVRQTS